uniref:Uncharacterized protein n=1 Tax=Rhizophora mucronata TaxID=61149 RepID=A0A2P2Q1M7_RHIMU
MCTKKYGKWKQHLDLLQKMYDSQLPIRIEMFVCPFKTFIDNQKMVC